MQLKVQLEGSIDSVIYFNEENGYTVFSVSIQNEDKITCLAYTEGLNPGETLKLEGEYIEHPIYGRQLSVNKYEKQIPTTLSGIEKYLSSGAIKGIGPKYANSIVKKFGEDTLEIIEKNPEKLAEIRGISLEKAENISVLFQEQAELRRIIMTFSEFGISTNYAMKIYKRYREHSVDIIKENPYVLSSDIIGIGFKIADKIATNIGVAPNSLARIKAGIKYILSDSISNGDVAIEKEVLLSKTKELLSIELFEIENAIVELQIEKEVIAENIREKLYIYQNFFFYAENYVAKKLLELNNYQSNSYELSLDDNLAELQKKAVEQSLKSGVLIITGGPGTGKTTTLKAILQIYEKFNISFELASPTGRAAKRMSETTGYKAKTIHRLLGVSHLEENKARQSFEKDEDNPIETDAIIIDETSMVDLPLMYHLLKAIEIGTRLILVGDADQLPSIGPGNILRDIINSEKISTVALKEIFRQAGESLIVQNAHKINQGIMPNIEKKDKDFFFIKKQSQEEVEKTIVDLAKNRLPGYLGIKKEDIQVLSPMRKSTIGIMNLNRSLQKALNHGSDFKIEVQHGNTTFRTFDRVMQIKNNYQLEWTIPETGEKGEGIFNGDEGHIVSIDKKFEKMKVKFYDNKVIEYDFSNLDELTLSYAITIHKSQGSEYDAVIIPIHSGPPMLLTRNLLYTGLTRAKKLAVFVGTESMLENMIANNKEVSRNSFLAERMQKLSEFLGV
ncbi:MAG: ATP-dependent RecD-like DNA helicase [Defluviitaleaceae bacterium]|nr:ATP-dependent RecD-like DNA helicase [Defluviitaleaceae bacterium]